ncbi:MAG: hypothetical protein J6A61_06445 [Clostridia bacterium]|nr:hypothetical protein [Clostridia bacterium]
MIFPLLFCRNIFLFSPNFNIKGEIVIIQILKLMFSVAGTLIGAGFATGKELQLFFKSPDISSLFRLGFSLALMAAVSLLYWNRQKCECSPTRLSRWLTPLFLLFSGGSYSVMLACGGEALRESFSLACPLGILVTWGITLFILPFGIQGVYRFNLIATPILIGAMIVIGFASLLLPVGLFGTTESPTVNMLTYTGYNLLSVLPFLSALPKATNIKTGRYGMIAGFSLVAFAGILLKAVLNLHNGILAEEAIPMLKIMGLLGPHLSYLYTVMLYGSILTTAVNCLYAVTKGTHSFTVSLILLGMGFLGFSTLLEKLYSFFGYLGIGVIVLIVWDSIKNSSAKKGFFKYDK